MLASKFSGCSKNISLNNENQSEPDLEKINEHVLDPKTPENNKKQPTPNMSINQSSNNSPFVGLQNRGNTCFLNTALQILHRVMPDAFDGGASEVHKTGKIIFDKMTVKTSVSNEELDSFYDACYDVVKHGTHQLFNTKGAQHDSLLFLQSLTAHLCGDEITSNIDLIQKSKCSNCNLADEFDLNYLNGIARPTYTLTHKDFFVFNVNSECACKFVGNCVIVNKAKTWPELAFFLVQRSDANYTEKVSFKNYKQVTTEPEWCVDGKANANYRLIAIMWTSSNGTAGHYMAYILDKSSQKWYCCNDSSVSEQTSSQIDEAVKHAKMLVYEKI